MIAVTPEQRAEVALAVLPEVLSKLTKDEIASTLAQVGAVSTSFQIADLFLKEANRG